VYEGFAEAANVGGAQAAFFDHSPLIGRANPLAPPLEITVEDDRVVGEVTFGSPYEGPPGCVHGGYVAAAFDEVLGAAQSLSGRPGMTGTLTVRYRQPTPLHTPLRFVGVLTGVEGRKIFTRGESWAGDQLTAEAEGIFVSVPRERMEELRARRDG
jgi:acyl-coenzyme A thioesterase PaaI-like protein